MFMRGGSKTIKPFREATFVNKCFFQGGALSAQQAGSDCD